ncbi:hypothetical protein B0H63DRAFT_244144 [Podospora didyma]|uniref:Uncharacterized protein n=1 Tax=Podospora didyma TaxID=330526 RepID=A0AAE0NC57_9PEZI|nr:hypothetical protein B0H63DRAFT_244144 [Podospora didyma]
MPELSICSNISPNTSVADNTTSPLPSNMAKDRAAAKSGAPKVAKQKKSSDDKVKKSIKNAEGKDKKAKKIAIAKIEEALAKTEDETEAVADTMVVDTEVEVSVKKSGKKKSKSAKKSKNPTEEDDEEEGGAPLFAIDVQPTKSLKPAISLPDPEIAASSSSSSSEDDSEEDESDPDDEEAATPAKVKTEKVMQEPPSGLNRKARRRLQLIARQKEVIQKGNGLKPGSDEPNESVDRQLAAWVKKFDGMAADLEKRKLERAAEAAAKRSKNPKYAKIKGISSARELKRQARKASKKAADAEKAAAGGAQPEGEKKKKSAKTTA